MPHVTLLAHTDCPFCEDTIVRVPPIAAEFGADFELVDPTSERGRPLARHAGMIFAPEVLIDGEPLSYGPISYGRFFERRLRRRLARHSEGAGG